MRPAKFHPNRSIDGCSLRWVAELRYLGIFIVRVRTFRCSLNYAKRSFFGVVNGLFGKLLNLASETMILELVRSKCMPTLLYGLESCELSNADLRSLDFTFNRLFVKLFKTKSIDVFKACQSFTGSEVPSCLLKRKIDNFILRFNAVENTFCNFYSSI